MHAAINAADNLTNIFRSSLTDGEALWASNANGTITTNSYSVTGTEKTTTTASGVADGYGVVTNGTKTITVVGTRGETISHSMIDIADSQNEWVLSHDDYTDYDALKRSHTVRHRSDGTTEVVSYSCCGLGSTTDRDGAVTYHFQDALHRQNSTRDQFNVTQTNILDAAGNVLFSQRVPSQGATMTLWKASYDDAGRMLKHTNALGGVTTYAEDPDDGTTGNYRRTVVTAPDGGTLITTNYSDGSVLETAGTAGQPVRYMYGADSDGAWTLTIRLTAAGTTTGTNEWTKTYVDMLGRHKKTIAAAATGTPTSYSYYNKLGQLTNQVDPDGVITMFQYNAKGELEYTAVDMNRNNVMDFDGVNGIDRITRTISDVAYNSTHETHVRRTRQYVLPTDSSSSELLVAMSEAATNGLISWQTVYRESPSTPVVSSNVTAYGSSGSGLRYTTNFAPDNSYTVATNYYGRLLSVTHRDANGAVLGLTTNGYDYHGRPVSRWDLRNGSMTSTYRTDADLVETVTSPVPTLGQSAQTTTMYYDTSLRAWRVQAPDGGNVTNEFHLTGQAKKSYGARTYPVEHTYDSQGQLATMKTWTNYAGGTGAATTTWNHDVYRGWLSNKVYQGGVLGPVYTNFPSGRLQKRTWARGVTANYVYNEAGDLWKVYYSDGTPGLTNTYDRRGRLSTTANGVTTLALTYNDANQLTGERHTAGVLNGLSVSNRYDTLLRRTTNGLWTGSAWLAQSRYGYDAASRLHTVTDGMNTAYTVGYGYLANSPLVGQVLFTNNTTRVMLRTNSYDFLNRLTAVAQRNGAGTATFASHAYAYNNANQRTRATLADGSYWLYDYDPLGQVRSGRRYWSDGTPVAGQQFEYGFDDIGNRTLAKAGGDANGGNLRSANFTNDALNRLTSRGVPGGFDVLGLALGNNAVTVNSESTYRKGEFFRKELTVANTSAAVWQNVTVAASGETTVTGDVFVPQNPESFSYDADGNMTGDGRWTLTWDGENRLTRVESLSGANYLSKRKVEYSYDGRGRMMQRIVSTNNGSAYVTCETNRFVYDRVVQLAELDKNNAVTKAYLRGLDVVGRVNKAGGAGNLLAVNAGANGVHFFCNDGNGNVMGLVNAGTGAESAQYDYSPFGETLRATGPMGYVNKMGFSSQYTDSATKHVIYLYRAYSPSLGRFLSRDPLGEGAGANRYNFVGNEPVFSVDVLGLFNFKGHLQITSWAYSNLPESCKCPCPTSRIFESLLRGSIAPDTGFDSFGGSFRLLYPMMTDVGMGYELFAQEFLPFQIAQDISDELDSATGAIKSWLMPDNFEHWWYNTSMAGTAIELGYEYSDHLPGVVARYATRLHEQHFGNNSWQHAMSAGGETAFQVQQKLVKGSLALIMQYRADAEAGNCEAAGFALGKALHFLQDSYSKSHTERVGGGIHLFQNYNLQSATKHGTADEIALSSDVFGNAAGASSAFICMASNMKLPPSVVQTRLEKVFYGLASGAFAGQTLDAYRKDSTTIHFGK